MTEQLTIGSMFSGSGGLDLAVESAFGARTVWNAEWEDAPSKVLARHWPGVPNLRDVTLVDWSTVPRVDILTGGFPCQDVSLAGRRAGMTEGTRSNLWGAMRTAIETIRPTYVVAENVRGLLSAKATTASDMEPGEGPVDARRTGNLRALGRVLGDLATLGYDARWYSVRASDVGAPHQRLRVFILAWDASAPNGGGSGDLGWSSLPGARQGGEPHTPADWSDLGHGGPRADVLGVEKEPETRPSDGNGERAHGVLALEGENRIPEPPNTGEGSDFDWREFAPAVRRWESVTRLSPSPVEPGRGGRLRLSADFTEWMMGLPAGWITDTPGLTRSQSIKMCGNGVVPQQAYYALARMIQMETKHNSC